jgi:hypothetical protein
VDQEKKVEMGNEELIDHVVKAEPERFKAKSLSVVDRFPTFFAEWETRQKDILLHLFPRIGMEDKWTVSYYLPICRKCRLEKKEKVTGPCPRCGHMGLLYEPGRSEVRPIVIKDGVRTSVEFPLDIADRVKRSVDKVWMGAVAIEPVDEVGAIVVQIQDAFPALQFSDLMTMLTQLDGELNGTPAAQ